MDCGISLFTGNFWMAFLTWIAFAVVATFLATTIFARRVANRASGASRQQALDPEVLTARLEGILRRLEALEARIQGS
jgi:membrane protein implicated in regulation of membrane protease activity